MPHKPGGGGAPLPAPSGVARLVALLPPDSRTPLSDYTPVVRAQEEARFFRDAARASGAPPAGKAEDLLSDVAVSADEELGGADAVELLGARVRLELPCRVRVPGLVLHLKDLSRFCAVEVHVLDATGAALSLLASNKVTAIRTSGSSCALPLELGPGWNILRMDLAELTRRAFGREFAVCTAVVVHAAVRVARIYFESVPLEDSDLPLFLRTLA